MNCSTIQQFASDVEPPEDDHCRPKYVLEIILTIKICGTKKISYVDGQKEVNTSFTDNPKLIRMPGR
jgi:hypothetical protein